MPGIHLESRIGAERTTDSCVVWGGSGAGALASCAAPLVGLLAERWFGFSGAAARSHSAQQDQVNAQALGSALLFFCLAPWTGTLLVYTGADQNSFDNLMQVRPCVRADALSAGFNQLKHNHHDCLCTDCFCCCVRAAAEFCNDETLAASVRPEICY